MGFLIYPLLVPVPHKLVIIFWEAILNFTVLAQYATQFALIKTDLL